MGDTARPVFARATPAGAEERRPHARSVQTPLHDPPFVLVLEDNADHAELLLMSLRDRGFRAECASDGSTSLSRILRELPSLVLLDVGVPRINGALIAKAMRDNPRTSSIPIVFQSARPEMDVKKHFADYDAYFFKPFDLAKLLAAIEGLTASGRGGAGSESNVD